MELYANANGGYGSSMGDCTAGPFGSSGLDSPGTLIKGILMDRFGTTSTYAMSCWATQDAWAVAVPLYDGVNTWCVDSSGTSKLGVDGNGNQNVQANWVISNSTDRHCW